MKPIEERITDCLTFLESIRPGYRYTITIKPEKTLKSQAYTTIVSVTGESLKDKSYPHVFLSVKLDNFNNLPEAIQLESEKLIQEEIEAKRKNIEFIQKDIESLLSRGESLLILKEKLKQ